MAHMEGCLHVLLYIASDVQRQGEPTAAFLVHLMLLVCFDLVLLFVDID